MNLLITLSVGSILIALANWLLWRLTPLKASQGATMVALATLGIYVPLAVLYWPGMDVFTLHLALYLVVSVAFGLIKGAREQAGGRGGFHWGPAAIIGFFVFLVAVDATLLMVAEQGLTPALVNQVLPQSRQGGQVSSAFPGTVSHDFQEKEALFNQYLRQVERQQQRGWQVRKGWLAKPVAGRAEVFKLEARTQEGEPVTGGEVSGTFLRSSDSRLDRDFTLKEVEPGVYQAPVTLPRAGSWRLVLQLRRGDDLHEIRANTRVLAP